MSQLRNIFVPYGEPNSDSRKAIEGATVTLSDGIKVRVDDVAREFTLALSTHFGIDEIQALILLRSFLYNEGLSSSNSGSDKSLVDELIEAITPFYYSERLYVLRTLIPLFRAQQNASDPIHTIAAEHLPKIIPDGLTFADQLIDEYLRKASETIPANCNGEPRTASRWAKQNCREQLVLLEVIFWTMWGYIPCEGSLVVRLYQAAYTTNLGSLQRNSTLLLDEEGAQILQDCAALWILITIEILELERISEPDGMEISASPTDKSFFASSHDALNQIHDLVMSNSGSQHACAYLSWAFVLSRLHVKAEETRDVPELYRSFLDSNVSHSGRMKDREPTYVVMARTALSPDAGLFKLLLTLLTTSPVFVTAAAWRTGSTVTDPNAIAFRAVLKGRYFLLTEKPVSYSF